MTPLALFNEGVPAHFFRLMEVPTMRLPNVKCCSVGPLECIFMALFEITHFWRNLIAWGKYDGHCYDSFVSEGSAMQTEGSDSRGGDGPQRLNGERSARAYVEARSKVLWRVNSPWKERGAHGNS